jgi:hypothetical protein
MVDDCALGKVRDDLATAWLTRAGHTARDGTAHEECSAEQHAVRSDKARTNPALQRLVSVCHSAMTLFWFLSVFVLEKSC